VSSAPSQLLETEQFAKWDAEGAKASHPVKLLVFSTALLLVSVVSACQESIIQSAGTIVCSHKRHPSTDRGASPGLRFDGNLAADQVQSLSHADEPQAVKVDGVLCLQSLLGRGSRHCYGIISPTENCKVEGDWRVAHKPSHPSATEGSFSSTAGSPRYSSVSPIDICL
jgi:hypothetical protein